MQVSRAVAVNYSPAPSLFPHLPPAIYPAPVADAFKNCIGCDRALLKALMLG